jgi:hypothetical protein
MQEKLKKSEGQLPIDPLKNNKTKINKKNTVPTPRVVFYIVRTLVYISLLPYSGEDTI